MNDGLFTINLTNLYLPYLIVENNRIVKSNLSFFDLTGYLKYEIAGKEISDVFKILRIAPNFNFQNPNLNNDYFLFTKTLDYRIIEIYLERVSNNCIKYIFSEKQNSRFGNKFAGINKLLLDEHFGIGVYSLPDFTLIKANEMYLSLFDEPYNKKEVTIGLNVSIFVNLSQAAEIEKVFTNVIKTGNTFYGKEIKGVTGSWKDKYYDNTLIPIIEDGKVRYVISMIEDVNEKIITRKKNEEKAKIIQKKNKQLQAIVDNVNDLIEIFDKNGNSVMGHSLLKTFVRECEGTNINDYQEYAKIYEWDGSEIEAENFTVNKVLRGDAINGRKIKIEFNGDIKYFEISGKPIQDDNGEILYGLMVSHDITEETKKMKLIEEQNEELEKALIMKDEFTSLISHEFKTPLNVIYCALQLIEHVYINQIPERVKIFIGDIKQNTFRQLRLVNNLLDITKLNSGQLKLNMKNVDIVSLTKVIIQSVKLYASQKNIKLYFKSNIKCKTISIDDEKYERIILNILSNSLKFTETRGTITVTLNENKVSNMVSIKITDTGIGIPKDKQELIFERFGQVESNLSRQAEGTGIGLYIVKALVNIMDGNIELKSELGVGSTFIVMLPSKQAELDNELETYLGVDDRLINEIKVEFSDIYL